MQFMVKLEERIRIVNTGYFSPECPLWSRQHRLKVTFLTNATKPSLTSVAMKSWRIFHC